MLFVGYILSNNALMCNSSLIHRQFFSVMTIYIRKGNKVVIFIFNRRVSTDEFLKLDFLLERDLTQCQSARLA